MPKLGVEDLIIREIAAGDAAAGAALTEELGYQVTPGRVRAHQNVGGVHEGIRVTRFFFLDNLPLVRDNLPLVDAYLQAGLDALSDATRMAIFQKLASGPTAVNELALTLPVSRPAVSQHLRVLKDAGLVTDRKDGTRRLYQLNPAGVARLRAHFDQMWTKALSAYQTAAEKETLGEKHGKQRGRSRRT